MGRRDSARTVSRGGRGQRPRPAPPRPGGSYQRERHGVRRGPEGLTGGQAGGRVSAARDAHTRGHYFCSERRATPRPGGRLYKAPPRWPDEEHLCRPRPRPRPLRSLQPCGPALRRPPWAWRGGGGEAGERDTTQEGASSEGRAAGGHFYLRGAQRSGALSAPLPPGLSFPFQVPKPRRRSCGGDARPPEHRATPLPFQ